MSDDNIKLAAALPKGELNGFLDGVLAEDLCTKVTEGRVPAPMVAILVLDIKKVEVDPESGARTAHLRIRRAQPVLGTESRRKAEEVLFDEYSIEHGPVLPFDVQSVTKAAFADLPRSTEEVDQLEEREREGMSPADELRKHLERVHGRTESHLLTDGEAEEQHRSDHDGNFLLEVGSVHADDWHGWTRADLETAAAVYDGENEDVDASGPDDRNDIILMPLPDEHLSDDRE